MRAAANAAAGRISPLAHAVAPRVYALAGIAAALLLALHKLLTSALPTVRCVGGEAEGRGGGGWRGEAAASATRACPSIQHASLTPAVPPHPLSVHPHSQKGAARRPTRSTAAKKSPSWPKRNGEKRGGERKGKVLKKKTARGLTGSQLTHRHRRRRRSSLNLCALGPFSPIPIGLTVSLERS